MSEGIRLYNTLTRAKEPFQPIDPANVRMYVCGPTVYDYAHIGNARPAIVFDVLFRLLRHVYGADHVTYVRNITDVDDKINARALRDFGAEIEAGTLSLNEAIRKVTETTYVQYQKDVAALGCLPPTEQPRATEFVLPRADGRSDMVSLIQSLIDRGHAYVARGASGAEVLFDTGSMPDYGRLSKRNLDEQQAGARVAVEAHKKNPADFVLWKESGQQDPGWEGQFVPNASAGYEVEFEVSTENAKTLGLNSRKVTIHGRPGWHIECSAMSAAYLGETFDIHGGGLDLIFPHHENEIAQSRCAHGTEVMANVWMHNGFVQVEGRKMSKSEGNFVTIHDLLETDRFGGRKWPGEVLRLAMLMTHYREPIDFSVRRLEEAENLYRRWGRFSDQLGDEEVEADIDLLSTLKDDLDFSRFFSAIAGLTRIANGAFFGTGEPPSPQEVETRMEEARRKIVGTVRFLGFEFGKADDVQAIIDSRLALIAQKNWAEADRIRDELLAQGIQLKDGKDPVTGARVTTWEVKR